ncbi:MAG: Flagellar rod assembly protein FlgJ [Candidatus Tokpelaia hoelldobleri]|uniref:Flagellar rod assembly protein FlgJ n=1 Tax=Candidatus Tokpelaia hoelldobleri TaxID=1902579 RepID=A0A1U9JSS6_9HYPH|nr:MAG: Flagellar rod assembly protein FlgJ [Candidatus Tokpelaia hoelldoblerii]
MAITPPSDLILDVAQAVDPLQYRASVEKLSRTRSASATAAEMADASFAQLAAIENNTPRQAAAMSDGNMQATETGSRKSAEAYQKFEAFMLQKFVEEMFTTDTPSVFGSGAGSDYWKSLMAEMIAGEVAKGGGIGIASVLAAQQEMRNNAGGLADKAPAQQNPHRMADAMIKAGQTQVLRTYFAKST